MKQQPKLIRGSLIYLITLVSVVIGLLIPVGIEFVAPFIGLFFFIKFKKEDRLHKIDFSEISLIIAYTLIILGIAVYSNLVVLSVIPWWQLILIGIAADLYASTIGVIPFWGDLTAGLLAFLMIHQVAGGITALILGLGMSAICLLPGPSMGANTLYLIIFKLISLALLGGK